MIGALLFVGSGLLVATIGCVELTFELADNARDCFYQEVKKNDTVTFEYQVMGWACYAIRCVLDNWDNFQLIRFCNR